MKVEIICNRHYQIGEIDKRLYGSFVEHMGRVVYSGIYEPGHANADSDGFRTDVIKAAREMGVTCVRYPGGNFVSCYDWLDSVGPKEHRPSKLDLAWRSIETNEFGINEFMNWTSAMGVEPILAVNLGTKGIENAASLLEYCNMPKGTKYSDLRREHGIEKPYKVSLWCLGNEMDGTWQIGHKTAEEYGRLAAETGKVMKVIDPTISLIACGSAMSNMGTHPEWDLTVLDHVYDIADYLSIHQYYGNQHKGTGMFLAQALDMERYINTIRASIALTKQKKHSNKQMLISVDEWGVWAVPPETVDEELEAEPWQIAPQISEQIYTMEDALLFASMLMAMLRNADIVKLGCQSLLANVSACIMTERGGEMWRQTIYYPFKYIAKYARGTVLQAVISSPSYACEDFQEVPYLDAVAVLNESNHELVLFAVNRSEDKNADIELNIQGLNAHKVLEFMTLSCEDPKQTNQIDHQSIIPRNNDSASMNQNVCQTELPPMSFNMIRMSLQ